ncbi:MAG: hypothetical protein H6607_13175 [Flavobacteriales bacterium]|nr:hypothetical protein [Flavobacteriales bacterium]
MVITLRSGKFEECLPFAAHTAVWQNGGAKWLNSSLVFQINFSAGLMVLCPTPDSYRDRPNAKPENAM